LGLGLSLRGGEEKVESVRVGLLGFRKDVGGVTKAVEKREKEVEALLEERREARKGLQVGRQLLEFNERLEELEEKLMVESGGYKAGQGEQDEDDFSESEDESEADDEDNASFVSLTKLKRHVDHYLYLRQLAERTGIEHPFLIAQEPRMMKVRNTLLLDLSTALKQAKAAGLKGQNRLLGIIGVYREMDEAPEAVKLLQSMKT
jgi:conserved oligomeric Golgi complex subunit 2